MSLVMVPTDRPVDRRPPHHPRGPSNRKGRGLEPEVSASTGAGRTPSRVEREVCEQLERLNRGAQIAPDNFKITFTGKRNGRHGNYSPSLKTGKIYLEVFTGPDLIEARRVIELVRARYGVVVVLITPELLADIREDVRVLERLVVEASEVQSKLKPVHRRTREEKKARRDTIEAKRPQASRPPPAPAGLMMSRKASQLARSA